MKVIQVSYDVITITLIVESFNLLEISNLINKRSTCEKPLYVENDKLYIRWNDTYSEECHVQDVTNLRGIIQYETH